MGESKAEGQPQEPEETEVTEGGAERADKAAPAGQGPAASPKGAPDIKWQGGPTK